MTAALCATLVHCSGGTTGGGSSSGGSSSGASCDDPSSRCVGPDGGLVEPSYALPEGKTYSTPDYAAMCVERLGEIPFFPKIADGSYETFDCRDFVSSKGPVAGAEGALIPLTVNDVATTKCDGGGLDNGYDCVTKCDRAMWFTASEFIDEGKSAACQPGPTVTHVRNTQGTDWVLLCRSVQDPQGLGMTKTKRFSDIALIGYNPKSGATCFFQNKGPTGQDGAHVAHPGDRAKSSTIWPDKPLAYCTDACHTTKAFVHSPWIDQAKRKDGKSIVPKAGEQPDYPLGTKGAFRVLNAEAQGFELKPELVDDKVAACRTCHRLGGSGYREFSDWSTGSGAAYYDRITNNYKAFAKSHTMPPTLDGLTAQTFAASPYGVAMKRIDECLTRSPAADCKFASTLMGRAP